MADPLDDLLAEHADLEARLADPAVHADQTVARGNAAGSASEYAPTTSTPISSTLTAAVARPRQPRPKAAQPPSRRPC